jgi:hypothetical protein
MNDKNSVAPLEKSTHGNCNAQVATQLQKGNRAVDTRVKEKRRDG